MLLPGGDWNAVYLGELESFPEGAHDEIVDSSSNTFSKLTEIRDWAGLISQAFLYSCKNPGSSGKVRKG